jgi:hypothetical protein
MRTAFDAASWSRVLSGIERMAFRTAAIGVGPGAKAPERRVRHRAHETHGKKSNTELSPDTASAFAKLMPAWIVKVHRDKRQNITLECRLPENLIITSAA